MRYHSKMIQPNYINDDGRNEPIHVMTKTIQIITEWIIRNSIRNGILWVIYNDHNLCLLFVFLWTANLWLIECSFILYWYSTINCVTNESSTHKNQHKHKQNTLCNDMMIMDYSQYSIAYWIMNNPFRYDLDCFCH